MSAPTPIISCRNVWKLYGDSPGNFMRRHGGAPDAAHLQKEGYIAAVRDVSLDGLSRRNFGGDGAFWLRKIHLGALPVAAD